MDQTTRGSIAASQLPAVVNDALVLCGAGLATLRLEQLHHIHPLDHLAEDNVPPAQIVPTTKILGVGFTV